MDGTVILSCCRIGLNIVNCSGIKAGRKFDFLCKITFSLNLYCLVFLILQLIYILRLHELLIIMEIQTCLKIKVRLES